MHDEDRDDPVRHARQEGIRRRPAFTAALRALADWWDRHPDVPAPIAETIQISHWQGSETARFDEVLATVAAAADDLYDAVVVDTNAFGARAVLWHRPGLSLVVHAGSDRAGIEYARDGNRWQQRVRERAEL
jgi:hypothetical protein